MSNIKKLVEIFIVFFKVGSFTFGGGYAMLPLIQKEVVDKKKWVDENEILDVFAISQSIPGVIAINSSVFVGRRVAGIGGAIAAAAGMTLPAFFSIILALVVLGKLQGNLYVEKIFSGIRAASAALILLAAVKLGKAALKKKSDYIIGIASFLIIALFNISAAWAVGLGAVSGYIIYIHSRRAHQ